ncbi:MAG: aconitate hydratase [Candidatus Tectomicrobia bacterium]|nr:aconitate hydratase [Candidatus Tectomicrobia bacterium]
MNVFQKIIREHLREGEMEVGEEIGIGIDQALIQDITGTVVMLNFEAMGLPRIRCQLAAAYGDHNVLQVDSRNTEDHIYLASAARKYGIWWGKPSCGIGHQIHQEHFAVPGATALGADSHTPHCGGMGMVAIGAGGLDIAVALGGGLYYVKMPQVVNVRLTGKLRPWCTAKDVILELLRRLTVRGGFGKVLEFTGPGLKTLHVQQRCTITNMGTELGATTSIFPSDGITKDYLRRVGRAKDWREILPDPDAKYDERIELDLGKVEPLVALPSLPDKVVPVREAAGTEIHQVFVGSCTNGSYMDLKAVAQIMKGRKVHPRVDFFIHPSSKKDLELLAKEGYLADLLEAGVNVAEPTCGACIGIGHVPAAGTNSLRVANRNFQGRSGLKEDRVYLSSAEVGAATAITGVLADPRDLGIEPPGQDLPERLTQDNPNLVPPAPEEEAARLQVIRGANIQPVPSKATLEDTISGEVLIKVGDDITTDHIMPAGSNILVYRSNIPKLAEFVFHRVDPEFADRAKSKGTGFIVGGLNYGQGSSREHAALAPMFLGIRAVIAKSFARIHMANLINWGLLPLQFVEADDYDHIEPGDVLELRGAVAFVKAGDTAEVFNRTKNTQYHVRLVATPRERRVLIAGGRLSEAKAMGAK